MKTIFKIAIICGLIISTIYSCERKNLYGYVEGSITGTFLCPKTVNGHPSDTIRGFCILLLQPRQICRTRYSDRLLAPIKIILTIIITTTNKTYTTTHVMLNQLCTRPPSLKLRRLRDGKKHAMAVLHRDHFPAKVPGP
jgi:hypothetical protein